MPQTHLWTRNRWRMPPMDDWSDFDDDGEGLLIDLTEL